MRFSLLLLSAASTRELAIAPHTPVQSPKHGRAGRICLVESEKPRPKKNAFGARLDADIVGEVRSRHCQSVSATQPLPRGIGSPGRAHHQATT